MNNATEAQGLVDGMRWLAMYPGFTECAKVAIIGDSKLVIDFMARRARPNQPLLVRLVGEARELVRSWHPHKIVFTHVTCDRNSQADYLSCQAFE